LIHRSGNRPTGVSRPTIVRPVWTVAVAFGLSMLVACGNDSRSEAPTPAEAGIRGVVLAGPQCAAVTAVSPCPDLPWDGIVRISAEGDEVAEVPTDAKGEFRLTVEPGTYEVMPLVADGIASSDAQTVTVVAGRFAQVALSVDTGIR
jgi:hypothetical protein